MLCTSNSYCVAASVTPAPCPANTASPPGAKDIVECKAIAGHHHNGGEYGTPAYRCPAGSYCPAESITPTPCPDHTTSAEGSAVITACRAVAGYYGPYGEAATICPKDYYCPAESIAPRVCPPNTQTDAEGAGDINECKAVPGYSGPWGTSASRCPRDT